MLRRAETRPQDLQPYRELVDEEIFLDLERLASRVRGLKVSQLNATSMGRGVAEILKSLVPLMKGLGVHTKRYCMQSKLHDY